MKVKCQNMSPCLRICIIILIPIILAIAPAACKEVAYVYDEGDGHVLKNVTAHNGTDIVACTVALGEGSSSTPSKISRTWDAIKKDITCKINN
jgi:hypothetical protein